MANYLSLTSLDRNRAAALQAVGVSRHLDHRHTRKPLDLPRIKEILASGHKEGEKLGHGNL